MAASAKIPFLNAVPAEQRCAATPVIYCARTLPTDHCVTSLNWKCSFDTCDSWRKRANKACGQAEVATPSAPNLCAPGKPGPLLTLKTL